MSQLITGLHHVTAISSNARKNVEFYSGILGLRMVKKTVNFDAPEVYHLYFGNKAGDPGTILTFFPYSGISAGRKGTGQLSVTSFSIPENSTGYWVERLHKFGVTHKPPQKRFNEEVIYLEDNDGLGLELVANDIDQRQGFTGAHIPAKYAIKGFYGVTLNEEGYERTAGLLVNQMDHALVAENGNRFRFAAGHNAGKERNLGYVWDNTIDMPEEKVVVPGTIVDVVCMPDSQHGVSGSGTVHHVAFSTANDQSQKEIRTRLIKNGLNVTPVIDRQYFHSIYFREPGGILFEIATSDIGFTVDEPLDKLGQSLKLPPAHEGKRKELEQILESVDVNITRFKD